MKIVILSPYHGGSHRAWAEGYQATSAHEVAILALPARFWKWRMHGGAVTLARRFLTEGQRPDLLLATDMLDLTTFLALSRGRTAGTPAVYYRHENQLTYPLPDDGGGGPMRRQRGERDLHYAFINFASAVAADLTLFNSAFHRQVFLEALPRFLRRFAEYKELDLQRLGSRPRQPDATAAPLVLWNQRWEYDKEPRPFFQALYTLAEEGVPFRLALCGENFRRRPQEFEEAQERLTGRIVHAGFAPEEQYRSLLWEATVTASTAGHEFLGTSVVEAIYCHTFPVLPNRLSYPELIPERYHGYCLYQNEGGLLQRLRWALTHPAEAVAVAGALAAHVAGLDWVTMAPVYDQRLAGAREQTAGSGRYPLD